MNILYCGDGNIADGLMMSVLSLIDHVAEPLNVYVLTMSYSEGEWQISALPQSVVRALDGWLKAANPDSSAVRIDLSEAFRQQPPTVNMETRFTPCCMLRLFADQVPQLPDRLLYLDNDVLCRGDPLPFYRQPLDGYELAGVLDHYGQWFFRRRPWKRDYLNSGVLLLNMEQIRRTGLFARCRQRCVEKKMFMPDQSALNKLAAKKRLCPRRYNEQRRLHGDTVFQHFTTSFRFFPRFRVVTVKPWDLERVHSELHLHEYDELYAAFRRKKAELLQAASAEEIKP